MSDIEFVSFPKIARHRRAIVVSEKIDGEGVVIFHAASRVLTKITLEKDAEPKAQAAE